MTTSLRNLVEPFSNGARSRKRIQTMLCLMSFRTTWTNAQPWPAFGRRTLCSELDRTGPSTLDLDFTPNARTPAFL
jgi:hypothetical protein